MYYNATNPPPASMGYGPSSTCTLSTCAVVWSVYGYLPSVAANSVFLVLFTLALIAHLYQGVRYGRPSAFFTTAVACGCVSEILGYSGRLMLWSNPFSFDGFLIQISTRCL